MMIPFGVIFLGTAVAITVVSGDVQMRSPRGLLTLVIVLGLAFAGYDLLTTGLRLRRGRKQAPPGGAARKLSWGPFSVALVATGLVGSGTWWASTASWGHWWFWPIAVFGTAAVVVFAASGVGALLDTSPVDHQG